MTLRKHLLIHHTYISSLLTGHSVRISFRAWTATPDFLRETGYQNPSSNTKTAFAKGYGYPDGVPFFEILREHPSRGSFNTFMKSRNVGHADWTQFYSVRERIVQGAKTGASEVLFVDCESGIGHQGGEVQGAVS